MYRHNVGGLPLRAYLGIDLGSVSTNFIVLSQNGEVLANIYLRTQGNPIQAVKKGLLRTKSELPSNITISGVGTTGSGRQLAGIMVGADIVKKRNYSPWHSCSQRSARCAYRS